MNGITSWRDFVATVNVVRPMLGISPSAWENAVDILGELDAASVVAAILQRSSEISSPGGYLRDLTRRAGEGEFSVGPIFRTLTGQITGFGAVSRLCHGQFAYPSTRDVILIRSLVSLLPRRLASLIGL